MMKLYIVRHAESNANATRRLQTHDSELSHSGVKQTESLVTRFEEIPLDVVITSPFSRSVQTAAMISSPKKIPLEESHLLANRRRASSVTGMSYDDPKLREVEQGVKEHMHDPLWHYADEENLSEFLERMKGFVAELEMRKEEQVAVVTHSAVVRGIVAVFIFGNALTVDLLSTFHEHTKVVNTGITICEKKDGVWKLLAWNDSAHLSD